MAPAASSAVAPSAQDAAANVARPAKVKACAGCIVAVPVARGERLEPCRVELQMMEAGEKGPTDFKTRKMDVRRLARRWDVEALRAGDWKTAAPLPLTIEQARAGFESARFDTIAGRSIISADVGDGVLTYTFDSRGRTAEVHWDPTARRDDWKYRYTYECPKAARMTFDDDAPKAAVRPMKDEDIAGEPPPVEVVEQAERRLREMK